MDADAATALALAELEQHGLLLMQDVALPSLVTLVAGSSVRGSWWSHPSSRIIYDVLQVLSDESLVVKLIAGKRTFVHRRLWPAVCAIGESDSAWQRAKLRPEALELLERVRASDSLRTDVMEPSSKGRNASAAATELEKRLLIHSTDEHTERGHHARVLESWARFRERTKLSARLPRVEDAYEELEASVRPWPLKARSAFPWTCRASTVTRSTRRVSRGGRRA